MVLNSFPPLEDAVRRRMQRFCVSLALIWYARKTLRSIQDNHLLLRMQNEFQPGTSGSQWALLRGILRYTFVSQLIASMEYLIPLAKPVLALRIARLLVWQRGNVVSNLAYGDHVRNTIDMYGVTRKKISTTQQRKPVILFVHGGAWSYGHKWQYGLVGQYLAKHGFLVGVINYRTYPTGSVQDQVKDVQDAIYWIAEHAESYGGDRNRIFLSGHSSGAHISALTLAQSALDTINSADTESTTPRKAVHNHIQGFIGLAGPYDITEHYEYESNRKVGPIDGVHELSTMKPAMLGQANFDDSSPTKLFQNIHAQREYLYRACVELRVPPTVNPDGCGWIFFVVDITLPRFHIFHGSGDDVVPDSSSKKLAENLRHAQHAVEYIELPGCTHEDILFAVMGDNVVSKQELIAHLKRITQHTTTEPDALVLTNAALLNAHAKL